MFRARALDPLRGSSYGTTVGHGESRDGSREPTQAGATPARTWTVKDLVAWMTDDLRKRDIDTARLDAELIVAQVLGVDRIKILLSSERELSPEELERIRALLKRRRTLEPIAYLRGE